ncbi:Carbamoyl-phosphate synthase L chain, ATP binding domain [Amycolatopsis xylanica]|uniref:Carbamoyl-phosphate synthase L chain, ATP binding domain n=1 Tax=Amycolatopsis xylanica TaxID=589385 RepID=A0A1H2U354_9PSEU|nr:ATP-grasp domain-containing protein [Amycolatopsis xylanica]SDW49999.1 Carbamoyl-phosphate synthase L chain, ATP binding domain [Amycolatopsis xylanica]
MSTRYLQALKRGLTGDPGTPLVFVCNFEVEQHWSAGFPGLPAPAFSTTAALVTRMEELGTLLAGPGDYLILQHPLDPSYVDYLRSLGFGLPTVLLADGGSQGEPTAARALASPGLLAVLGDLAKAGARLAPMGVSAWESRLAEVTGLRLAAPELDVVTRVNSKIYSRRLVAANGLREVPGWCCETASEFVTLMAELGPRCTPESPVVVKDAYGVSGKGLVVVTDPRKAERLARQVRRQAERKDDDRLHVVVERWLPKRADLNYQLTVDPAGAIRLDFVKEALTSGGVHIGHISPAALDARQLTEIEHAAAAVGRALHADGFWGVAGVDALVTTDGVVYPVLEINARFNMSTYQGGVLETRGAAASLAGRHVLRLNAPLAFEDVHAALPASLDGELVITCFGTVNAMAGATPFEGRLFTLALGPDRAAVTALTQAAGKALEGLAEGAFPR